MSKILTLLILLKIILAIEVVPYRNQLEYFNKKYIKYLKVAFSRRTRQSPYHFSVEFESYVGFGNNLTLKMALLEEVSAGHYQPTPIIADYKLCDFLYKEPFFGQMYAKQLTGNWSCPFAAGKYNYSNLILHLENFPFHIPFTWSDVIIHTRVDVQGVHTTTGEEGFRFKTYATVTQKLKKPSASSKKKEKDTTQS